MANTYCHESRCDLTRTEEKNSDTLLAIGLYTAFVVLASAAFFYAHSHGIYFDPAIIQ